MTQYRKKSSPVEAAQYDGTNAMEVMSVVVQAEAGGVNWSPNQGLRFSIGRKQFPIAPTQWIVVTEGRVEIMNHDQFQDQFELAESPKPPTPSQFTGSSPSYQGIAGTTLPLQGYNTTEQGFAYAESKPGEDEYYDIALAAERGGEIIL